MPNRSRLTVLPVRALATIAVFIGVALPGMSAAADGTPGGSCTPPGTAARYGENGVLMCSVNGIWVVAMKSSESGDDSGAAAMATDHLAAAMQVVMDQVTGFVHSMLSGN
ncbi:hypothetical protein [Paraburkholderia sp. J8-2]|uniref:hypothetical protein n=1 Tax=Paraburkholderia sp. J8-2 TaxID=2805440 RepID=UPI002AB7A3B0|nr:hypothetical protein [Paraburkholderia sp. J8-2]